MIGAYFKTFYNNVPFITDWGFNFLDFLVGSYNDYISLDNMTSFSDMLFNYSPSSPIYRASRCIYHRFWNLRYDSLACSHIYSPSRVRDRSYERYGNVINLQRPFRICFDVVNIDDDDVLNDVHLHVLLKFRVQGSYDDVYKKRFDIPLVTSNPSVKLSDFILLPDYSNLNLILSSFYYDVDLSNIFNEYDSSKNCFIDILSSNEFIPDSCVCEKLKNFNYMLKGLI